MGYDKLTPFEKTVMAKARAAGRYQDVRGIGTPWKPVVAPEPTLNNIRWATKDISLAAFLVASRVKPLVAVNLQGRPVIGFDRVPEKELLEWESGPKGKVDMELYAAARTVILDRCASGRSAGLETVLLKL